MVEWLRMVDHFMLDQGISLCDQVTLELSAKRNKGVRNVDVWRFHLKDDWYALETVRQ